MSPGVMGRVALAAALSASIFGVAGCVTPRVQFVLPDPGLLEDCPKAGANGIETNLDLAARFNLRGRQLDDCNADKAGLRAWRDALED